MTVLKLYLFILFNLFVLSLKAQHKKHSHKKVHLATCVLVNNVKTKNYAITLYENSLKIDSIFIEDIETIDITLKSNRVYTIEIAKEGCDSRIIVVNTNIPNEIEKCNSKPQQLHVHLSHKGLNNSIKDDTDELVIDNEGLMDYKSNQGYSSKRKSSSRVIYFP